MAKQTIIKKWSEDTNNKYALNEDMVKMGIERMSPIISNQLNSVANRADTFIDLLQRCSAWNVDKTYQIGDICMVSVYYKRASDTTHKYYIMFLLSTQADNKNIPLINAGATSFTRNDDLTTPCFTITANVDTLMLSGFVNAGWAFCDSTCGDLTNCVNLSVSDVATFKGNVSLEGVVNALSNLNVSGNASLNGNTTITGASAFNGNVTLNGALNTATTPDINAKGNEIITADWALKYFNRDKVYKNLYHVCINKNNVNLNENIVIELPYEFINNITSFGFEVILDNGKKFLSNKDFMFDNRNIIYTSQDFTLGINDFSFTIEHNVDSFIGFYNNIEVEYSLTFDLNYDFYRNLQNIKPTLTISISGADLKDLIGTLNMVLLQKE